MKLDHGSYFHQEFQSPTVKERADEESKDAYDDNLKHIEKCYMKDRSRGRDRS